MSIVTAILPEALAKQLVETCRSRLPYETCGVLYGQRTECTLLAEELAVIRNIANDPARRFQFDPSEWIQAQYRAQKNQREIVGFFHTHPDHAPVPSSLDLAGWDGSGSYWIVGFTPEGSQVQVYAWRSEREVAPLQLFIT